MLCSCSPSIPSRVLYALHLLIGINCRKKRKPFVLLYLNQFIYILRVFWIGNRRRIFYDVYRNSVCLYSIDRQYLHLSTILHLFVSFLMFLLCVCKLWNNRPVLCLCIFLEDSKNEKRRKTDFRISFRKIL